MKSIKEKAKAYNEAIERVKGVIEQNPLMEYLKKGIEYIFPELKESEEETLIYRIIQKLRIIEKDFDEDLSDEIAWLERKGEKKPTDKIQLGKKYKCIASPRYSTFMLGKIYKPEDKFLCSLMNFCSDCFEPIEDGEQKPADNIESSAFKDKLLELFQKFRYIKEGVPTNGDIIDYVDAHIQELIDTVQNKPWSEEDNEHLERILKELKNQWQRPYNRPYLDEIVSDYYWLKSLKDRVQPKQEWSKEDESKRKFIEDELSGLIADERDIESPLTKRTKDLYSALYWLKSLRPQVTWKPSDKQMEALDDAIAICSERDYETECRLDSLRQDLKKLKGE